MVIASQIAPSSWLCLRGVTMTRERSLRAKHLELVAASEVADYCHV